MSSLVVVRGRKKISEQQKKEIAEQYGIPLIKLRHLETCEHNKGDRSTNGFRPVYVSIIDRGGKRAVVKDWHKNIDGQPAADHQLTFYGNEFGEGFAYLPDDPDGFNRRKLAGAKLGPVQLWEIVDPKIDQEITALAEKIKASAQHRANIGKIEQIKTEERVRREQERKPADAGVLGGVEAENLVLENRIKELEAKKRNEELRLKLVALQEKALDEQTGISAMSLDAQRELDMEALRERIKQEVWAENKELIDRLKETGPGWHLKEEYRTKISPLINERLQERLDGHTRDRNGN